MPHVFLRTLIYLAGNEALVSHMICSYFLPARRLSFHFVYDFLCCTKVYNVIRSHLFILAFISISLGD